MSKPLRLLIVGDSADAAESVLRELRRGDYDPVCEQVDTADAMAAALGHQPWDTVISAWFMPKFSGLAALELLKRSGLDLPFIIVSGAVGEETAVAALKAGAHDYLMETNLGRLASAIDRELRDADARQQRRRAEQQLRLETTALEAAANGIVITDRDGAIVWVNPAFTRLTGYTAAEAIGRNPRLLKSGQHDPLFFRNLWETILSGNIWRGETINRKKDGSLYTEEQTIAPVRSETGAIAYFVAIKQDVTERRRVENALRESEEQVRRSREQLRALAGRLQTVREQERTNVAREIHDELGQALTVLKIELDLLDRRTPATADKAVSAVKEKLGSMSKLLDQTIVAVRRIATDLRPGVLDDLGLAAAIEWQAREFQKRTNIHCELKVNAPGLAVLGPDRSTAVFRILQEILTNVARHAQATNVSIGAAEEDSNLVLEVRDDGKGITEEQIAGTQSLGLLGMQERAHVFGGSISFTGKFGQGTTVRVLIPLAPNALGADPGGQTP